MSAVPGGQDNRYVSPVPLLAASDAVQDARAARNRAVGLWALWGLGWVALAMVPASGIWFAAAYWDVLDDNWRKVVLLVWVVFGAIVMMFPAGLLADRRYLRPGAVRPRSEALTDARRKLRDEQRQDES